MMATFPSLFRHQATPATGLALVLTLSLALAPGAPARAACSRTIVVPVAPNGKGVTVSGGTVGGFYPDLLRRIGQQYGCTLAFTAAPLARLEVMFDAGQADLLLPTAPSQSRDRVGQFVPLVAARPALVSVTGRVAPLRNVADLLARRDLRVVVVRGYDYGSAYQDLIRTLAGQRRLVEEVNAVAMARLVQAGSVDAALIGPTVFYGAVESDPRLQGLVGRLRVDVMPELPWGERGAYISRRALPVADQATLRAMLVQLADSGAVLQSFQRSYQTSVVRLSVRAP